LIPPKHFNPSLGSAGALTDAASRDLLQAPSRPNNAKSSQAYFDPSQGIGYTFGRTHINSCDFSSTCTVRRRATKSWPPLTSNTTGKYRIPFHQAGACDGRQELHRLFASPWSPPAWIEDNNDMLHGGSLKPEFNSAWANYYANFIEAYAKEGIPIWGVSVQKRADGVQTWESCVYTAQQERDFIKITSARRLPNVGLGDKKIIAWDHNRTMMYQRAHDHFR